MKTAFVLYHVHTHADRREDAKLLGIYSTRAQALAAIERLKLQPGFCDHPRLIDPLIENLENGFSLDEYVINQDHWSQGYVDANAE
jgi:hypothetical protein